ncbi:hypothetical protein L529_4964 [Bordetella bronchiseptica MBORD901]|nr:hypothetical protein L529_4964 [Bordetella bronchiseptica MBORD901]
MTYDPLNQVCPGPLEGIDRTPADTTRALTGNTEREQETWFAGIEEGQRRTEHNASVRATANVIPASARDWAAINAAVDEYLDGYELQADEGYYAPTEFERYLIVDAVAGLLSEDEILTLLAGAPSSAVSHAQTAAARDVLAERQRQISAEGWTPEHDDAQAHEQLARAAVCYALPQGDYEIPEPPEFWPWDATRWKPGDRRRELIKAGALILAEIERLDRAPMAPREDQCGGEAA